MRITLLVNDVHTEVPTATTTILARAAARRGHAVYMIGIDQLTYFPDGRIGGLPPGASRPTWVFLILPVAPLAVPGSNPFLGGVFLLARRLPPHGGAAAVAPAQGAAATAAAASEQPGPQRVAGGVGGYVAVGVAGQAGHARPFQAGDPARPPRRPRPPLLCRAPPPGALSQPR